jgi:hypothetical protein
MDYVETKVEEVELSRQVQSWQRKVDVAEMSLKRDKKILKAILREETFVNGKSAPEVPKISPQPIPQAVMNTPE